MAQKPWQIMIPAVAVTAALFWALDAFSHAYVFQKLPFWESLIFNPSRLEILMRSAMVAGIILSGLAIYRILVKRQLAERALWEGERLLANILASIQEGLIIKDREFRIIRVNPVVEKWFSFAGPLVGRRCFEAFHGASEPCERCPTVKTLKEGSPSHAQVAKMGPGGEPAGWLDRYASSLVDRATGEVKGVIEFVRDITAELEAENALRESEQKSRLLVKNIPAVVFKGYSDWSLDFVDDKIEELTGYSKEEFNAKRMKWRDLILPEDLDGVKKTFLQALKTTKSYIREYRIRHKSGQIVWIQALGQIFLDEQGQIESVGGVFFDISDRKQAEADLQESEKRYRLLAENVTDVIWIMDLDLKLTYISPAVKLLTGYRVEEYLPLTLEQLMTPASQEVARNALAEELALENGDSPDSARPIIVELELCRQDGSTVWVEAKTTFLRDTEGRPVGLLGVTRDITVRRKLEDQLRQAQKMEVVGRLAGGVAHDFNNLLTAILGYSELLLDFLAEHDPLRQDVAEIKKAGERGALLTRQLLAFSRRQILQPKLLDLNLVLENMGNILKRVIGEDIELSLQAGRNLGRVMADPGQIEQVVMNLAVNARDAMPQGGKLTLETANITLDAAYVRLHAKVQPGAYVMLAVTDNGCGMSAETRRCIFEPFFTTKEVGKGTGLGLSTVYGIITQSGGYIWVYSEPGRGATFKIYLPQDEAAQDAAMPGQLTIDSHRGQETVLLVEDEDVVRQIAQRILQRSGYTVLAARNGQEALKVCAQHPDLIHLLLTDLVMPNMNGMELAKQAAVLRPSLKVLFMSGYAENAVVNHIAGDQGAVYIQKPFEAQILTRRIRQLLDSPS
jgi:two-component system, cell cycle sensor histidine kinase and response regulator CckA